MRQFRLLEIDYGFFFMQKFMKSLHVFNSAEKCAFYVIKTPFNVVVTKDIEKNVKRQEVKTNT